jgi:hypothetical protein
MLHQNQKKQRSNTSAFLCAYGVSSSVAWVKRKSPWRSRVPNRTAITLDIETKDAIVAALTGKETDIAMAIETEVEMVKNAMAIEIGRLIATANMPARNRAATNLAMRRAPIARKANANRAITPILAAIEKESRGPHP